VSWSRSSRRQRYISRWIRDENRWLEMLLTVELQIWSVLWCGRMSVLHRQLTPISFMTVMPASLHC
jgi:hypothetical protein